MWLAYGRWVVHRLLEVVMLAPIRLDLLRPHQVGDLQSFFQSLEALSGGRERYAQAPGLALVPSRADAEVSPSAREHVEGGYGLYQDTRITVVHARYQGSELHPIGDGSQEVEGAVALEHGFVNFADHPDLEEVVHHPEAREAGLVSGPADLRQLRSYRGGGVGPSETRNLQSYAHLGILRSFRGRA